MAMGEREIAVVIWRALFSAVPVLCFIFQHPGGVISADATLVAGVAKYTWNYGAVWGVKGGRKKYILFVLLLLIIKSN
jgi:hypothetical protein